MKKTGDIVNRVSAETGLSQTLSKQAVGIVFETIVDELMAGGEVRISGFGSFRCRERPAGTGRDPRTGEAIQVAAKRSPQLRAAKGLRDALNPPAAGGRDRRRA